MITVYDRTQDQTKRAKELGISFVESALVFPLVMVFIFGIIDLSIIARQYIIVTEALSSVGRKSSVWRDSCVAINNTLMSSLQDELKTNLATGVNFNIADAGRQTHNIGGGVSLTGRNLSVRIRVPCQLCKLGYIFGTHGDVTLSRSEFYPFENQSCT